MQAKDILQSPPLSILTVDDSPSDRALLSAKLHKFGHRVTEAADGYHALACLSDKLNKIDLILLDVRMPGIDGFELAQHIRKHEQEQDEEWRPIIFLSGRSGTETIVRGIEAGGDDYLTKPVDSVLLQAKIIVMQRIAATRKNLLVSKQQLEVLAHTDELTQLSNRRHFQSILDSEIARAERYNTPLSVAYMDLDHFKQVNDTHGHKAGDIVLQRVTDTLTKNLRNIDSIGRVGGEEFCFCLPGTDAKNALGPCERYRLLIENLSIPIDSQKLNVTASFGLTSYIPGEDDASSLMMRADKALYQAKKNGRNRIEIIYPWDNPYTSAV